MKVAVLGATGIVGQQFVRMLSHHPVFEIEVLAASERSVGKRYEDAVRWVVSASVPENVRNKRIVSLEEAVKSKAEVFFVALPSKVAAGVEEELRRMGKRVFSNASSHRMDPDVPLVVPEVNHDHLEMVKKQLEKYGGFIVTNSNCSTAGLVMVLKPLMKLGLRRVFVSTYQALSGAGLKGHFALEVLGNVIPFIPNEEEKIRRESRKILGRLNNGAFEDADIDVAAACCRVPVREGHLESVFLEFKSEVDVEDVKAALENFSSYPQIKKLPSAPERPLIVHTEADRPQPALDVFTEDDELKMGMSVHVGRVRKVGERVIGLFLLVHNTIRGAAGGSVLNAECAMRMGFLG